jgi:opacity protein-like surface antigen
MALALLASSHAASAGAEPPAPGSAPPARAPYSHHGFYLRFASGFAAYDERLSADNALGGARSGRNRGIATLGELAIGGSPAPRWVLGGAIYSADLLASTYRSKTVAPPVELDPGLRNVALIAPFFDYALQSVPGVHVQAALGLATLTPRVLGDVATSQSEYLAAGAGLMFGGGYEWDIAENWRLGVLSRTTLSVLGGHDDARASWLHVIVTSPGLLLTITYQ